LAWGVSVAVFDVLLSVDAAVAGGYSFVQWLAILAFYVQIVGWVSLPFALVGVALVHLTCRRIPSQAVHVAAAGLAGGLPWAVFRLPRRRDGLLCWLLGVPVATAVARWSVVPLVTRRRRAALSPPARAAR
jgi:hypothetical protein